MSIPNERLLKLQRREIQRKRPRLKRPRLRKIENHLRRPDKLSRSIYKLAKHKRILNAKLSKKRRLLKNSSTNDHIISNTIRIVEIVQIQVSAASQLNRLSPIICTWFESPKVALYAGKLLQTHSLYHRRVMAAQNQNIFRMVENCPNSRLHSSKTKGVSTPKMVGLQSPSLLP